MSRADSIRHAEPASPPSRPIRVPSAPAAAADGRQITASNLLDAGEVAALLRVDRRTILRWALTGYMPSIKRGRRVLFLRWQVEQWLLDGSRGQRD